MKQQKQYSRRHGALRYVVRAVIVLLLVNHFMLIGILFPAQAIRRGEERRGTGRTAVVLRDWAPEIHWGHLLYLTESENVTMLSAAHLTVLGWSDGFGVPVDCSETAPIYGGYWSMNRREKPSLFCVFGRIDDPDVVRLEVQAQYEDRENGEAARHTAFSWDSDREDWIEKDGRCYFLFQKYPVNWSDYPSSIYPTVIGYDRAGNEITRLELEARASSYYG